MSLANPLHALAATIVLAFVIGEFTVPDLVGSAFPSLPRRRLAARLCSLPIYAAAVLWAYVPELAWLGLTFVVALGACDLLETWTERATRGCAATTAGGAPPPPRGTRQLAWAYAILGLRLAALSAFVTLVLAVPRAHWPGVTLPAGMLRPVLWAAAYLFVLSGGSALVGQVLDAVNPAWRGEAREPVVRASAGGKGQVGPAALATARDETAAAERETAAAEGGGALAYQQHRGRIIGNVERLIVLTLVCLGQFGAIGLVVAAKSLARFPLLSESRDFAEYYLIGTLMSMAVAIGTGLALSLALARI